MSGEVTASEVATSAFDSTSLHSFIRGAFPNAILMEEHQVAILLVNLINYSMKLYMCI